MDSDWKPRLWAVPLQRHYMTAGQTCLPRQTCMLRSRVKLRVPPALQTSLQQLIDTQTHFCCRGCCTCSAAQLRQ